MDPNLATRLDEIMHRMTSCSDGSQFDSQNPQKRDSQYGAAICGAQGAISNIVPGAALEDFLLVRPPTFVFAAGDIARAVQIVIDFANNYAPMMALPPDVAEALGGLMFALAIDTIINNIPLGSTNPIRQSIISSVVTTTTTSCASSSSCVATCSGVGASFYYCETSCVPMTQCITGTSTAPEIVTITTVDWAGPPTIPALPTNTPQAAPQCSMDQPAVIQWDVFSGSQYSVAAQFCNAVTASQANPLSWTVDIYGNQQTSKLKQRSPPVTPDTYKNYQVSLVWIPAVGFNPSTCPQSCNATYQNIAEGPCK